MGTLRKTEWSEKLIQNILKLHFFSPNYKKYEITNLYVYGWESDYLAITKSMMAHEVEIKISKEDFKNDFKHKQDKHLLFEHLNGGETGLLGRFSGESPNYFYYAVPYGLIDKEDIPDYAGLIYVKPYGIEIVKDAKKLTEDKFDGDKLGITDKFYFNMENWKNKYESVRDSADEIKELKKQIKGFNKTFNVYEELIGEKDWEICELKDKIKELEDEIKRRNIEDSTGALLEK